MSIAGSHWKGDASGRYLQRLYGTAFFDKKELAAYLEQIEEAKRRDHRVLGRQHAFSRSTPRLGRGFACGYPRVQKFESRWKIFFVRSCCRGAMTLFTVPTLAEWKCTRQAATSRIIATVSSSPLFGSEVGGLLDAWSRRLEEGTLDSDGEEKLIEAAKVFGVELPRYRSSATVEDRQRVLHDWQRSMSDTCLNP